MNFLESHLERFEQFLLVNDVTEQKTMSLFFTIIGSKCYEILHNSLAPEKPSAKTYAQLREVLMKFYTPEKCIIAERYRFHKCFQKPEICYGVWCSIEKARLKLQFWDFS